VLHAQPRYVAAVQNMYIAHSIWQLSLLYVFPCYISCMLLLPSHVSLVESKSPSSPCLFMHRTLKDAGRLRCNLSDLQSPWKSQTHGVRRYGLSREGCLGLKSAVVARLLGYRRTADQEAQDPSFLARIDLFRICEAYLVPWVAKAEVRLQLQSLNCHYHPQTRGS
jgi:hypothetical protein